MDIKTPKDGPDRKELIYFERKTGLCKEELSTLSEHNLFPSKNNFFSIKIFNKPDCPVTRQIGFTVKTHRRIREIPLDNRSINFIRAQLVRHKNDKIFGKVTDDNKKVKYIEYRFLFPVFSNSKWHRCDNFLGSIQKILDDTNKKYNLGFTDRYQLHDFRRTLNGEMGDAEMSAAERAVILGHSEDVNKFHYMNYKKLQSEMAKKAQNKFKEFLNNSPSVRNTPHIQPN